METHKIEKGKETLYVGSQQIFWRDETLYTRTHQICWHDETLLMFLGYLCLMIHFL